MLSARIAIASTLQWYRTNGVSLRVFLCLLTQAGVEPVDALAVTLRTVQEAGGSGVDEAVLKDLKRRQLIELGLVLVAITAPCTHSHGSWVRHTASQLASFTSPLVSDCVLSSSVTYYAVTKGPKFALTIEEEATDITKAMLAEYGTPSG